ncbi:MAG TPA: ABC transporter ATP-binding protein, partial [Candidatus Melainabacteria bacterium]|nr:ABC transporter ATP-binding protein [Candidatus Melainabacteria bacterium]
IQAAVDLLRTRLKPWQVSIFADRIHLVILEGDSEDLLNKALLEAGIAVLSSRQIPFSLEDSFIGIVERIREMRAS